MVDEIDERLISNFTRMIQGLDNKTKQEMLDFLILHDGVRLLIALRRLFVPDK